MFGASIIGFGLSRSIYWSLLFLTIMGAGDMISTIIRSTLRQMVTPDHLRGRMVSINTLFIQGGPKLGDAEAGFLAQAIGAPLATVVGGSALLLLV